MKVFGSSKKKNNGSDRHAVDDTQYQEPEAKRKKGRAGKIILTILVIIAICLGGFALYWKLTTKPPETDVPGDNNPLDSQEVTYDDLKRYYTILLVGEDQEHANTDTIMLMRFDTQEKRADIVSIPRDTVINVPGSAKKINSVYHHQTNGGIEALKDQVQAITGFRPNNYIFVNLDAFEEVVSAIGGVWFDVPQDMVYDHWSEYDDSMFLINVKKGYQNLNGHDALSVWRYREGYANGDIDRLNVQHDLLYAIAEQVMNLGLEDWNKLLNVMQIGMNNCETDLTMGNIQWYASEFLKMDMEDLSIHTAPVTGCYINDLTYVTLDVDSWITMINASLNPYNYEITAEDCAIVYAKNRLLINNQYHIETKDLAVTDGSTAYTNFLYLH